MNPTDPSLHVLRYPYRRLRPWTGDRQSLRKELPRAGSALVWSLGEGIRDGDYQMVRSRPGGVALILVLPPAARMRPHARLLSVIEATRPAGILPYHEGFDVEELSHMLRRPPNDLAAEVTDYLSWRGLRVSQDSRHIIRRTIELSAELRSIQALARSLYLSRRALGRRFESAGLPVPSHWLHFARLLRVTLRLQNSQDSVVAAGFKVGYPDGFSLSNQMHRLTGYRPTEARRYLGWEWFLEAWLRAEVEAGGLTLGETAVSPERLPQSPPSLRARGKRGSRQAGS